MAEILASENALPFIPDDLSVPQFLLDVHHPSRPVRTKPQAWFIDEISGREIGLDEVGLMRSLIFASSRSFADMFLPDSREDSRLGERIENTLEPWSVVNASCCAFYDLHSMVSVGKDDVGT